MKRCPQCNSTYSDDTLRYCLSDGAKLLGEESEETVDFSSPVRDEMRIDVSKQTTAVDNPARTTTTVEPEKKGFGSFLLGVVAAGLLVGLLATASMAVYFLVIAKNEPVVAKDASPKSDSEVEDLKKRVDELQGRLNEDEKKKESPDAEPKESKIPVGSAIVNSPGDGFLALRTIPNHKTGKLIVKIPHGSVIRIISCRQERLKIGKRSGSWCMIQYGVDSGWVFDAWLRR